MNSINGEGGLLCEVRASVRVLLFTMAVCCALYPLVILGVGQILTPHAANGSLIYDDQGEIVGSKLLAQAFSRPEYFWPRPSAVDYCADAAGGSNLSPANPELRDRAKAMLTRFGAAPGNPMPADLVTESGSGLDPDITLAAAKYQAERVASARGLPIPIVMELLEKCANLTGSILAREPIVNVLRANMALDRLGK